MRFTAPVTDARFVIASDGSMPEMIFTTDSAGPHRAAIQASAMPTGWCADMRHRCLTLALAGGGAVRVTLDTATIGSDGPRDVKPVIRRGTLMALTDSYPSKPRGAGLCQAGSETWFRVIDTKSAREVYARLVDSCAGKAQWGDPPYSLGENGARVTLNLLSEPPVTITLGDDGRVSASR